MADDPGYKWAFFDRKNRQHMVILSYAMQFGWKRIHPKRGLEVADLEKLGAWLSSTRSPVRKPLRAMTRIELSRVIKALEQMVLKEFETRGFYRNNAGDDGGQLSQKVDNKSNTRSY